MGGLTCRLFFKLLIIFCCSFSGLGFVIAFEWVSITHTSILGLSSPGKWHYKISWVCDNGLLLLWPRCDDGLLLWHGFFRSELYLGKTNVKRPNWLDNCTWLGISSERLACCRKGTCHGFQSTVGSATTEIRTLRELGLHTFIYSSYFTIRLQSTTLPRNVKM